MSGLIVTSLRAGLSLTFVGPEKENTWRPNFLPARLLFPPLTASTPARHGHLNHLGGLLRPRWLSPSPRVSESFAFLAGCQVISTLLVQAQRDTLRTTCLPVPGLGSVPNHMRTQGSGPSAPAGVWHHGGGAVSRTHPYTKEMDMPLVKAATGGNLPITQRQEPPT